VTRRAPYPKKPIDFVGNRIAPGAAPRRNEGGLSSYATAFHIIGLSSLGSSPGQFDYWYLATSAAALATGAVALRLGLRLYWLACGLQAATVLTWFTWEVSEGSLFATAAIMSVAALLVIVGAVWERRR
jgi:hypothetical protein